MNMQIARFIVSVKVRRNALLANLAHQKEGAFAGPVIAAMWMFGWPLLIL